VLLLLPLLPLLSSAGWELSFSPRAGLGSSELQISERF
jgi:hypothetical protein